MTEKMWYAVQVGGYEAWDNGSYDLDEAKRMALNEMEDGDEVVIAVIDEHTDNPVCVQEIRYIDGAWDE